MPQQRTDNASEQLIDLGTLFAVIRARLWPILIVLAVVAVLTFVAFKLTTPKYAATSRVAVERTTNEIVNVNNGDRPAPTADSPTVDTQVQVLESPAIAGAVVDRLRLAQREGFGIPANGGPPPANPRDRAIAVTSSMLTVSREGTSYAIAINAMTSDPQLSADLVNTAADVYVNGTRAERSAERRRETDLLAERLGQLRGEATQADRAVADYRASTNLADLTAGTPSAQELISGLTTQLAQARAELAQAQARAGASQRGALDAASESPVVRDLRTQQARLAAQRDELAGRYGPRHPSLQALNRQIAEIDGQLRQELRSVRVDNGADAAIVQQRVASLESSLARARGDQFAGNESSVRLNELQRNAESARALYQAFLDRYRQSVATQGAEPPNAQIIALATAPNIPASPNPLMFVVGGIIAALLGAGLVVLLLELMERGYRSRSEAEADLGVPVIAMIPDVATVKGSPVRRGTPLQLSQLVLDNETSLYAESIRSIRTALRLGQEGPKARSIAIASSLPGEGKTTAAISLARSAARAGINVVLVDCDLRRRTSSRNLVQRMEASLVDVLRGTQPLEKALVQDSASGAYLLPQQADSAGDFDIITSRAMESLIERLTTRFDLVVLDTAPVVPLAEARAIAAMADATLLVVRWRKTPAQIAETAVRELQRSGANVIGVALAQVDARAALSASDMAQYQVYEASFA